MRRSIEINYIEEGKVFLLKDLAEGLEIVTVGVSELFGAESGMGGGH
jgi:hypothetical protein